MPLKEVTKNKYHYRRHISMYNIEVYLLDEPKRVIVFVNDNKTGMRLIFFPFLRH